MNDELNRTYEAEMGERYAKELDEAAKILQRVHPIGKVKAIGRLEVVAALLELFPVQIEPVNERLKAVEDNHAGLIERVLQLMASSDKRLRAVEDNVYKQLQEMKSAFNERLKAVADGANTQHADVRPKARA